MDSRKFRLGNKKPHEDIGRRQQRNDRRAGRHRLPRARQHVSHAATRRRRHVALRQPPRRHIQRSPRSRHRRALCLDLVVPPHRPACLLERRLHRCNLGLGRQVVSPALIDALLRGPTLRQQRLAAGKIGYRAGQGCFCVRQVGFGLQDLGWLAALLQIAKLPLRLRQQLRRLVARCPIVRIVLVEQLRAGGNLVAARNVNRGQQPLLRRTDHDKVGLRIPLPNRGRWRAIQPPPIAAARRDKQQQRDYEPYPSGHIRQPL